MAIPGPQDLISRQELEAQEAADVQALAAQKKEQMEAALLRELERFLETRLKVQEGGSFSLMGTELDRLLHGYFELGPSGTGVHEREVAAKRRLVARRLSSEEEGLRWHASFSEVKHEGAFSPSQRSVQPATIEYFLTLRPLMEGEDPEADIDPNPYGTRQKEQARMAARVAGALGKEWEK
jgi:hypothetical protein